MIADLGGVGQSLAGIRADELSSQHRVEQEGKRKPQWQVSSALLYGQVIKRYRRRRMVRVEHVMQWGVLAELKTRLKALGLSGRLNTAFVERVNLTIRQGVSMLIRRTWGTAQTVGGLKLHLAVCRRGPIGSTLQV